MKFASSTSKGTQSTKIPFHISRSIEKSIKQYQMGEAITIEEFKKRHFTSLSK